jgi:tellurite resistance protein TerC
MFSEPELWIGFHLFILVFLLLDLGVFQRRARVISLKEACLRSICWITLALLFNLLIYFIKGPTAAVEFFTGYLIEKSLSVDNLFVFFVIFSFFKVPSNYQSKVLYWGIIGALAMRITFILAGTALIHQFSWLIYVLGIFLCGTAVKLFFQKEKEFNPEKNLILKACRSVFPITNEYHDGKFFIRKKNQIFATPLFLVILVIESTDIIFATDSIPAIFAITTDPFIVYTSNVFAVLGLKSLYFILARFMSKFRYIKIGLSLVLFFIGIKMLISSVYKMPIGMALGIVVIILAITMSLSWRVKTKAR